MWNNPVNLTDPDGNCPMCVGFVIGAGLDIAAQMVFEGKSLGQVDYGSALVSGSAGALSGGISSLAKVGKGVKLGLSTAVDAGESITQQVMEGGEISGEQFASDMVMSNVGGNVKLFGDANIKAKEGILDTKVRTLENTPNRVGRQEAVADAKANLVGARGVNQAAGTATSNTLQEASDNVREALRVKGTGVNRFPIVETAQDNTRVNIPIIKY